MTDLISIRFQNSGILSSREPLRRFARQLLERCLEAKEWPNAGLSVYFCSPEEIRRLNSEYRGEEKTTDVLSFPWIEDLELLKTEPAPYLGDLVLSLQVCADQAPRFGRDPADEVALLLVHGFLHLLGYEHDTKQKERAMWRETDRLLQLAEDLKTPPLEVKPL